MSVNVDPSEVERFEKLATRWWDPQGEMRPLHLINPLRTGYVAERAELTEARVLDVGCGGGLLTESLATAGARVTGIDPARASIQVAQLHAEDGGLEIEYLETTAEVLAEERPAGYDVITCMEMLEHVPDPSAVIGACRSLLAPGGHLFLSTISRNPKAWLLAVVGAEYVLGMLPRGTHDYERFIRPSELASWCRAQGFETEDLSGISFDPLSRGFRLSRDVDVNYLMHCTAR